MKSKLIFVLKAIVSIVLITVIISKIDWENAVKQLSGANIYLLSVTVLIALFIRWLMAFKWNILLSVNQTKIPTWNIVKIIMIGGFLGMFLPSSLSTDVVRGYYLTKENTAKLHVTSTIIIDRLFGILSLLITGIIGVCVSDNLLEQLNLKPILLIGTLGIFFIFIILFNKKLMERFNAFFENKSSKIHNILLKGYNALSEFYNYPKSLACSFFISLGIQFLRIIRFYLIAEAINVNIPFIYFIVVVPAIMIVLMIPISLGGLGVKEGAAISLLILLGITRNDAIVLTLIESLTTTFVTLLGGLFYLSYKKTQLNNN